MAIDGTQEDDCPHCPSSEAQGHPQHHGSAVEKDDKAPCASASDDCSLSDDVNYDGRNAAVKLKDLPLDVPLAIGDLIHPVATARPVGHGGVCPTRGPPPDSSPPLNVLYCVYLD